MADFDPNAKVQELLSLGRETEWLECKTAGNNYNFENLGKYFSALSNEANLHNRDAGWLIFGVANDGSIVGTNYRATPRLLDALKHEIAEHVSNGLTFPNIFDVVIDDKRVLLFKIPPAMRGMPTDWKGHYYGRDGESLVALSIQKMEAIRGLDEDYYAKLILDHIAQFGSITRREADDLLFPKISDLLNDKQKKIKLPEYFLSY